MVGLPEQAQEQLHRQRLMTPLGWGSTCLVLKGERKRFLVLVLGGQSCWMFGGCLVKEFQGRRVEVGGTSGGNELVT